MAAVATIKAIEAGAVHQIQSGQVIVDLCSVAKELVENSIDAGATSIEVRFKNQGLDSIEVLDNGSGIPPQNYETLALKHYTSKLSSYADLGTLQTFGFRGEALSSLCALSRFSVVTCLQPDVPKGTRLEFEPSGKLKGTSVVAAQKGTTVFVEELFYNLPVRRRELERNIKREWGKVVSLLNQYACVQTGVKFTVSQQPNKGRRIVLFSTKGNPTTRENIVNVFGAKTMGALVALDLKLALEPTSGPKWSTQDPGGAKEVLVRGFVSRPVHGEGRQTPDRQMFYVNGRPCGLPQFAKVFNEVYRSYNISQSPFIFADIQLDTHLYDVNVSPDKRTILLHDQSRMLDNMRDSLVELFEAQTQTVPVAPMAFPKTPLRKPSTVRQESRDTPGSERSDGHGSAVAAQQSPEGDQGSPSASEEEGEEALAGRQGPREPRVPRKPRAPKAPAAPIVQARDAGAQSLISRWMERKSELRIGAGMAPPRTTTAEGGADMDGEEDAAPELEVPVDDAPPSAQSDEQEAVEGQVQDSEATSVHSDRQASESGSVAAPGSHVGTAEDEVMHEDEDEAEAAIPVIAPPTKNQGTGSLPRSSPSRPLRRSTQEVATITIGDHTVTSVLGPPSSQPRTELPLHPGSPAKEAAPKKPAAAPLPSFRGRLTQMFSAGTSAQQATSSRSGIDGEGAESSHEGDAESSEGEDAESSGEEGLFVSDKESVDEDSAAGHEVEVDAQEDDSLEAEESRHSEGEEEASSRGSEDAEEASQATDESRSGSDNDEADYVDRSDLEDETQAEEAGRHRNAETPEDAGKAATEETEKRSEAFAKGGGKHKSQTLQYLQHVVTSEEQIREQLRAWQSHRHALTPGDDDEEEERENGLEAEDAEERLSLIISKADFGSMKIVGQFNLGFILAVRPAGGDAAAAGSGGGGPAPGEELFIIDQHASDEKYNFERLQASTVVQSQRLVRPKPLDLTALEEEIIIEHRAALEANGFVVGVDASGDEPVGSRCQLLSLPLSRETTFSLADLEELVSLLGEHAPSSAAHVPRPSKVRKMFAMRACRSSIMIGRALSQRQMERVVRHMGEMEKPWNCPHGRPTMRHLCGLRAWDGKVWAEGDDPATGQGPTDWAGYVRQRRDD